MTRRLRIAVLGYIVRGPLGGLAWHHLQYVLGLVRLGHEVCFLEDSDDYPACYDPAKNVTAVDPSYGIRFAKEVFRRIGLAERWAYHDAHTGTWLGPFAGRAHRFCESADLLLNVSGVNPLRPWLRSIPIRVMIDTDPVFTQVRNLTDAGARALSSQHTAFFSFGENIGTAGCAVPDDGFPWQATRQPVVLDAWCSSPGPEAARFTTVMQWDSYSSVEYGGSRYGMKSKSFTPYLDLPRSSGAKLELALGSPNAPRSLLREHGWLLCDPLAVTRDPWSYQRYIASSKAEFGIAKHAYVASRSGWFSERSAGYLASGRPVLVQDTGFSSWLSADSGVLAFDSPEQAVEGLHQLDSKYKLHCEAAREIVREYFDAEQVLSSLIERCMRHC